MVQYIQPVVEGSIFLEHPEAPIPLVLTLSLISLYCRYLVSMLLLLVRVTVAELVSPRGDLETQQGGADTKPVTNITENRLDTAGGLVGGPTGKPVRPSVLTYRTEAENYAVQHQVLQLYICTVDACTQGKISQINVRILK